MLLLICTEMVTFLCTENSSAVTWRLLSRSLAITWPLLGVSLAHHAERSEPLITSSAGFDRPQIRFRRFDRSIRVSTMR